MALRLKRSAGVACHLAGPAFLITLLADVAPVFAQTTSAEPEQLTGTEQAGTESDSLVVQPLPDIVRLLLDTELSIFSPAPDSSHFPDQPVPVVSRASSTSTGRVAKGPTQESEDRAPGHSEGSGEGEHNGISYGGELDFNSGFVWRGIALSNRPVVQPSLWISARGFAFTAWNNFVLGHGSETAFLHVTDLSLTYDRSWNKFTIEPALETYLNRAPRGIHDPNSTEASLKVSYAVGSFHIFTLHAADVFAYRGSYFGEAGLGYDRQVTKRAELEVSFRSGWASSKFNNVYIGIDKPAFNLVGLQGSVTYYLSPRLYLRPHLEFSNIVDRQLRQSLPSPSVINAGLVLGVEF